MKSRAWKNFSACLGCVDGPFVYTCEGGSWPRLVHFSSSPALYIQLNNNKESNLLEYTRVPEKSVNWGLFSSLRYKHGKYREGAYLFISHVSRVLQGFVPLEVSLGTRMCLLFSYFTPKLN